MHEDLTVALEADKAVICQIWLVVAVQQLLLSEGFNEFIEIPSGQWRRHVRAIEKICAVYPAEMDEDLSLRITEDKPRVSLIGYAPIDIRPHTGCVQQALHAKERCQFLVGPV